MLQIESSLIIPVYNEEANIITLLEDLESSGVLETGISEVIFVENGSIDSSRKLLQEMALSRHWMRILLQDENLGYGGGLVEGITKSKNDLVCFMPGDIQVSSIYVKEALKIASSLASSDFRFLIKGWRQTRSDGIQTKFVSSVYTFMVSKLLKLETRDVNGLPKLFNKNLLLGTNLEFSKSFVFDAELILLAAQKGWTIVEFPIHFNARRRGVSSWSGKRIKTYINVTRRIFKLKKWAKSVKH